MGSPTLPHLGDPQGPLQPPPWMPLTSGWDRRLAPAAQMAPDLLRGHPPGSAGGRGSEGDYQIPPTLGVTGLRAAGGAGHPPLVPLVPSHHSRVQPACSAPTVPLARAGHRACGKGASPGSGPYHALTNRQGRGAGGPACPGSPADHLSLCCSGCVWGRGGSPEGMRRKAGDPERQPERWGAFLSSGATIRSFRPEGVRTGAACVLLGARAGAHGGRATAVGLQVEGGVAGG